MVKCRPLDRTFAALADPTRRAILDGLEAGPKSVSDLAAPLELSLPGLLKHVRVLEDAALVVTRKDGRTRLCSLAGASGLDEAERWIDERRRRWERRVDRFEDYLKEKRDE